MISLRLSKELEDTLEQVAESENRSKSDVVKEALAMYFADYHKKHSPYDLGKDLWGKHGSGSGALSRDYKQLLQDKLRDKHSH